MKACQPIEPIEPLLQLPVDWLRTSLAFRDKKWVCNGCDIDRVLSDGCDIRVATGAEPL
jgi:hypothetical protein